MGLCISRLHFEKGLPSIEQIRRQFKKQTGIDVWIKADVNLLELPLNSREVVEKLNQDIIKYENFRNKDFNHNWEKMREESRKINHINYFQFFNIQFYGIDFRIEEKTIEIEYQIGCCYFPSSLEKTLYDLGGEFEDFNNQIKEEWNPPKHWKKLKHWENYKWFNRPKK